MAVTGTARIFGLLASIVRAVAAVIGGLILIHAVFVLFGANSHNILVQFTAGIRDSFGWFTKNLFQPSDKKMAEAINDALAGFIWVFLGSLVAKFIARLAPASKSKDKDRSSRKKDDTPRSTPVQKNQPTAQPKQEAPKEEAPKQEEPKREAPEQEEPKQEAPKQEESEEEGAAKHQARDTARDDERAGDTAEDKSQDKAQA